MVGKSPYYYPYKRPILPVANLWLALEMERMDETTLLGVQLQAKLDIDTVDSQLSFSYRSVQKIKLEIQALQQRKNQQLGEHHYQEEKENNNVDVQVKLKEKAIKMLMENLITYEANLKYYNERKRIAEMLLDPSTLDGFAGFADWTSLDLKVLLFGATEIDHDLLSTLTKQQLRFAINRLERLFFAKSEHFQFLSTQEWFQDHYWVRMRDTRHNQKGLSKQKLQEYILIILDF